MAWLMLITAGLLEVTWALGLKVSQLPGRGAIGLLVIVAGMSASLSLLWLAQQSIPIGTAYAVWTGIGAAGTFLVGILLFDDAVSFYRLAGVSLIIAGVILLKLTNG